MDPIIIGLAVGFGILIVIGFGFLVMFSRFYVKVPQGQALIISTTKDIEVSFTGRLVLPIIHKSEIMDISLKTIEISRSGRDGLICEDNIRADIKITFFIRVNENDKDVLKVAKNVGCARASNKDTLEELFGAKFSEALKSAGKQMPFEDLFTKRYDFRDKILENLGGHAHDQGHTGGDLNGYILEDVAIDYLEQTPLDFLNPENVLDAKGRKEIVNRTAAQVELENERNNERDVKLGKQNLEREQAMMNYRLEEERKRAETERAISDVQSLERANASEVREREATREAEAKLKREETINIKGTAKRGEEQRAEKNLERDLALQDQNIQKEIRLVALEREQTVELREFAKNEEVEKKKKEIAKHISERIHVEKSVAVNEEEIKDLRAIKEAERNKNVRITNAEGVAQEKLVVNIKAAEAEEKVAKHKAQMRLTMADAELQESDKKAKSKIRLSEGIQAEVAAEGLAQAKVKEVTAAAIEKEGLAKATVLREQMLAEAKGTEEKGLAEVRVKQASIDADEKRGLVEAKVKLESMQAEAKGTEDRGLAEVRIKQATIEALQQEGLAKAKITEEQGLAQAKVKEVTAAATEKEYLVEAKGIEEKGLADVRIKEADALVIEKRGVAEATAIEKRELAEATGVREKLVAEAAGLAEKANAMKLLDGVGREHEEFRLRLEQQRVIRVEQIHAQREIAKSQAVVLGEAFKSAKVEVVGGDGSFFQRYMEAASMGRSIDAFVNNSDSASAVFKDYLDGSASLTGDVKDIMANLPIGSQDIQRLSVSAFLASMMTDADAPLKAKLQNLLSEAKDLGIDQVRVGDVKSDA